MTMATEKKLEAPQVDPRAAPPPQGAHKNPLIGPKTGNLLPNWSRFRDYENFNPTAEK